MSEQKSETERMRELVDLLNRASEAYYARDTEIMSNLEYDRLYDELTGLENRTHITLADSPTVNVGYASVQELPKERHASPMLSLGKTKDREELAAFLGDKEGLLSWKLDGLTVVLTYREGKLEKAVTRGNGEIGEVITQNARTFRNIPLTIPYDKELIIRGEAVIRYSDFERINGELEEASLAKGEVPDQKYKNPRNLCSGSVRQLSSEITAKRSVRLYVFTLVSADGGHPAATKEEEFRFLRDLGFETVEFEKVTSSDTVETVGKFERAIETYDIPSDGLVLTFNDIAFGQSLGRTAKFPRDSIAFKWADEIQETELLSVEWSASRTGLINPVAVFAPVELEGTTVRRASVHNVSIVRELRLGIGDRIRVYKANMIIPQIAENLTGSGSLVIPAVCPVCGGRTEIRADNEAQVLVCPNPQCPAKKLKSFVLFAGRNAMNIDGLSEMTLEKLLGMGFIHEYADIYHLRDHSAEIAQMEGFGEKSASNLLEAVEVSRDTTLGRVLYALGIPGIGAANAKVLAASFNDRLEALLAAADEENAAERLSAIDGIGEVLAGAVTAFLRDPENRKEIADLVKELRIAAPESRTADAAGAVYGKTFVITGSVNHFANRDELKAFIEELGGKTTGSVSRKTDYLINNDVNSASSKNTTAKKLGIPILSEDDFLKLAGKDSQ